MSWTLIEHQALTSSVASVTLGSGGTIPQTYKTLKLVVSARSTYANTQASLYVQPNGSSTNITAREILANGTSVSSHSLSASNYLYGVVGSTATANTFSNVELIFPNYAGSTNKPASFDSVGEDNTTSTQMALMAFLWSNTAAITSLYFTTDGNFVANSTFTLYGLA